MKPVIQIFTLAFFLLVGLTSTAQEQNKTQGQTPVQTGKVSSVQDTLSATGTTAPVVPLKKTAATIITGLIFAPHLHYYGRTDVLKSDAYLPTFNIEFDSLHVYASATSVFLNNRREDIQYAGTIVEAGYRFGKLDHFSGNAYGNKFFYDTRDLPQSALKEQVGVNLGLHTKKFINFSVTGSGAFSDERTDFFTSAGINKIFKKKYKKSVLLITPTYVVNFGSQNFSSVQYKSSGGTNDEVLKTNSDFTLLDYELTVPVVYARKHIFFIATPSLIIPENIVRVIGYPELSETAKNLFYVNLTVLYSFKF